MHRGLLRNMYGKMTYLYLVTIFLLCFLFITCKLKSSATTTMTQNDGNLKSQNQTFQKKSNQDNNSKKSNTISCFVFLLIMTSPKGELRRKAMRETWLKYDLVDKINKVERRFIVGTKDLSSITTKELKEEQSKHSDLLFLEDFKDSYYKLTEKLLRTLIWINENVDAKFVMKLDDDSFVRLEKLVPSIIQREPLKRVYWGFFRGDARIKRKGPWKEPGWFLSDHYIPYALGGGYLISTDLVNYIANNANYFTLYNSEDVSLGVWISPVKVNRFHDVRFDTESQSKGCSNIHVVSHKQQPEDMYAKHNQLIHHNRLCKTESELFLTYDYNWNELPIRCCKRVSISTFKHFL